MVTTTKNRKKHRPPSNAELEKYNVVWVKMADIKTAPENDQLYGEIVHDEQMDALIESIKKRGLEEPLILTADYYIASGHRRRYAAHYLGWEYVPCRIKSDLHWKNDDQYHRTLAEYNPQRIKTVGSLLKESLLRDSDPDDTYRAIQEHQEASARVDVEFMRVPGCKHVRAISDKKKPFLEAVQRIIEELEDYLPLSIRQIHYNLLNRPPLISVPKRSSKPKDFYRYKNDQRSYDALVNLLKSARYHGHISMNVIDDPTRPQLTHYGWSSVSDFVHSEIEGFLSGYHRDRQ